MCRAAACGLKWALAAALRGRNGAGPLQNGHMLKTMLAQMIGHARFPLVSKKLKGKTLTMLKAFSKDVALLLVGLCS